MSKDWLKWERVAILLREDGRVQVARVKDNPLEWLGGEPVVVQRMEDGYLFFRSKGRGKKNGLASVVIGRSVLGDVLLCIEWEDAYGERRLDGMTVGQAKQWLKKLKKIKKEALASATRKSR